MLLDKGCSFQSVVASDVSLPKCGGPYAAVAGSRSAHEGYQPRTGTTPWRAPPHTYACVPPLRFLRHDSLPFPARPPRCAPRAVLLPWHASHVAPHLKRAPRALHAPHFPYEERKQGREPSADPHGTRRFPAARQPRHLSHLPMHPARPPTPMRRPSPALSCACRPLFFAPRAPTRSLLVCSRR